MTDDEQRLVKFGAELFDTIWNRFCFGGYEIEIQDLIEGLAVDAGLVVKTAFNPELHTDESGACEPGDDYWEVTIHGRRALTLARDAQS